MIAAAVQSANANSLGFNWFDIVVFALLLFGVVRGRRNGMTKEFLPVLEWLAVVLVCGLVYSKLAGLADGFIRDMFWSCVASYLALAAVVFLIFMILKRLFAEKMVKSDFFKSGEYYLGMLSGLVRYACMLMFVLALLNAPVYSAAQVAQQAAYDQKNFGGGLFAGNYFPHLSQIQASVFEQSFIGPRIKNYAGRLLINTGQPGAADVQPGNSAPSKPKPIIKIGY
jgi:uncharacterized membrane protein required for colicin V production